MDRPACHHAGHAYCVCVLTHATICPSLLTLASNSCATSANACELAMLSATLQQGRGENERGRRRWPPAGTLAGQRGAAAAPSAWCACKSGMVAAPWCTTVVPRLLLVPCLLQPCRVDAASRTHAPPPPPPPEHTWGSVGRRLPACQPLLHPAFPGPAGRGAVTCHTLSNRCLSGGCLGAANPLVRRRPTQQAQVEQSRRAPLTRLIHTKRAAAEATSAAAPSASTTRASAGWYSSGHSTSTAAAARPAAASSPSAGCCRAAAPPIAGTAASAASAAACACLHRRRGGTPRRWRVGMRLHQAGATTWLVVELAQPDTQSAVHPFITARLRKAAPLPGGHPHKCGVNQPEKATRAEGRSLRLARRAHLSFLLPGARSSAGSASKTASRPDTPISTNSTPPPSAGPKPPPSSSVCRSRGGGGGGGGGRRCHRVSFTRRSTRAGRRWRLLLVSTAPQIARNVHRWSVVIVVCGCVGGWGWGGGGGGTAQSRIAAPLVNPLHGQAQPPPPRGGPVRLASPSHPAQRRLRRQRLRQLARAGCQADQRRKRGRKEGLLLLLLLLLRGALAAQGSRHVDWVCSSHGSAGWQIDKRAQQFLSVGSCIHHRYRSKNAVVCAHP